MREVKKANSPPSPKRRKKGAGFLLHDLHTFMRLYVKEKAFTLQKWHTAVREWEYLVHKTKQKVLLKFLMVAAIVGAYLVYVVTKFGGKEGLFVTLLTWSFFVFCTPVADAGIILDFPVRFFTGMRMLFSEIGVWVVAASINTYALLTHPQIYETTILLRLLEHILRQPWPYWSIIVLSAMGTFLSLLFGDELIDVAEERHRHLHQKHRHKHALIALITIVVLILILYEFLLSQLGVTVPLF